ncbi:MAG: sulfatase-like hydrolase/transferase [Acholeplasmataceae bacterium]|nr:sulfatase-like hydrolase/transferase [Acholeplasmataceae bacterium]
MKKLSLKKQYFLFIIAYVVLNILNTYFLTVQSLNRYIEPFRHTLLGEINQIFGNFVVLFLFAVIFFLIYRKAHQRMASLIYFTLFLNFAIFALGIFNLFYGAALSADGFVMFKNPTEGLASGVLIEVFLELITYYRIIVFLPTIILTVLYFSSSRRELSQITFKLHLHRLLLSLLGLASIGLVSVNSYYRMYEKSAPIQSTTSTYAIQNLGVYPYYLGQLFGIEFDVNYEKILEIQNEARLIAAYQEYNRNQTTYINPFDQKTYGNRLLIDDAVPGLYVDPMLLDTNDLTGIFKDKNLVLIHLESFNNFLLDLPETNQYMPFLNALFKESFVFNNFFTNVGMGVSSDGELAVLTGINPTGDQTLYWKYDEVKYEIPSLVTYFKMKGSYTEAIHGDYKQFYNREIVYPDFYQFDQFYALEEFIEDGYVIEDGYLYDSINQKTHHSPWISDYHLADYIYQYAQTLTDPYFLFPVTMMGHTPYEFDPFNEEREHDYVDFPQYGKKLNPITLRYLNFTRYYDDIVKRLFIDEDGQNRTLNNTIYIFYSDHGSGLKNGDLSILYGRNLSRLEERRMLQQVTAFIYAPHETDMVTHDGYPIKKGQLVGEQNLVRSQIDLYRTIVELFALPVGNDMYFGTHGLSKEPTFAVDNRLTDIVLDDMIFSMRNSAHIFPSDAAINEADYAYILRYKLLSDYLLSQADLLKQINQKIK